MNYKNFTLIFSTLFLIFLESCNLDMNWPGVCESRMSTTSGNTYFYCETTSSADVCESSNIGTHVYSSETCKNLGYTEKGKSSISWKDGDTYFVSPDGATSPGANGYFVSSSGTGGSASCDLANYNGPEFDPQVDTQCKTAYLYDCAGNNDGVTASCALYYQWESSWQGSGSFPKCPYCP